MDTLIQVLNLASGGIVLLYALLVINSMGRSTCHLMRVAFLLLAGGSFALVCLILVGAPSPSLEQTILNLGIASFCIFDRRGRKRMVAKARAGMGVPQC